MQKHEFIENLKNALLGNVPPQVVNDNLKYYEEYIASEIQKGREESEVLDELGDPRILAKTIIDASARDRKGTGQVYYGSGENAADPESEESSGSRTSYSESSDGDTWSRGFHTHVYKGNSFSCLIVGIILLIIICVIVAALLKVIWFLAPVIIALVVLRLLFSRFR